MAFPPIETETPALRTLSPGLTFFILSNVKIRNLSNKMEMEYKIVAENEADIKLKKISIDSPIGKGLLGKSIGDIADVHTPNGIMKFDILEIVR